MLGNVNVMVLCYQWVKSLTEILRMYIEIELAEAGDTCLLH